MAATQLGAAQIAILLEEHNKCRAEASADLPPMVSEALGRRGL